MKTKMFKSFMAFVLAFITFIVNTPLSVFASGNEESSVPYVHIDGERVPLSDERILNFIPVRPSRLRASQPNATDVLSFAADFERGATVTMDGSLVSAQRYGVNIDGVEYEAFCANPNLPGPESAGAVYELAGEGNTQIKTVLKNGYPVNSQMSSPDLSDDDRLWNAYVTRVAVAMANNSSHVFAGDDVTTSTAKNLIDGVTVADDNLFPAIMVNGGKTAEDNSSLTYEPTAQSGDFVVTYNRKTNLSYNLNSQRN